MAPQIVIQFHIRLEAFTPIIFIERTSCIYIKRAFFFLKKKELLT